MITVVVPSIGVEILIINKQNQSIKAPHMGLLLINKPSEGSMYSFSVVQPVKVEGKPMGVQLRSATVSW